MSNQSEPARGAGGEDVREAQWQNPLAQSPDAEWSPDDQMERYAAGADSPDDVEELDAEDPRKWGR